MSTKKLQAVTSELLRAIATGAVFGLALMITYLALEPAISRAVTDEFVVTQEITGEISFSTPAADVTMSPAISSLTGGTSTGATQVVVSTNSATGYTMDIQFDNGSNDGGVLEDAAGNVIPDLQATGTPDYDFTAPANSAAFGYTVEASSSLDIADTFEDDGASDCSGSGTATPDQCWLTPATTTSELIVNSASLPPLSGSTSTVKFQVVVSPNPSPAIPSGFYYATATLTALNQ
jgi:hypothetical protein